MNKKYWIDFYKKNGLKESTSFAKFGIKYFPKNATVIDMGCGSGRDSYFFAKKGFNTVGIDYAIKPIETKNVSFRISNIKEVEIEKYDVVYSRFFLHSINDNVIDSILERSTKSIFIAEFREKNDVPLLYKNHGRNLIDGNSFLSKLIERNYDIIYYKKGYDMAVYKKENPLVVRIVAEGNELNKKRSK